MLVVEMLRMALCGGLMGWWLLIGCRVGVRWVQCWRGRLGEVSGSGMHVEGGHWDNAEQRGAPILSTLFHPLLYFNLSDLMIYGLISCDLPDLISLSYTTQSPVALAAITCLTRVTTVTPTTSLRCLFPIYFLSYMYHVIIIYATSGKDCETIAGLKAWR